MIRKADSCRRIKDALSSRIQPYLDYVYGISEKIVFLDNNDSWTGPGIVQGLESKTLFVIYNGEMRKVAVC